MKTITSIIFFAGLALAIGCNNAKDTKDIDNNKKDSTVKANVTEPKMDSAAMMKAWQDYMTPGEMHKLLASFNGDWVGDITMWMSADAPPSKSTGYCTNKMVLEGRYQISENKGSFGGMPFGGINTLGFDNAKKVFVSSWIDNMGTGIMVMEGPYNAETKTISFKGKCVDPMTGKEMIVREDFKIIDNNTQLLVMYNTQNGKEYKSMEIKYSRK